jgi:hypothetical protein
MSLQDLCGYASRRSRKRGFVFVSKVLGKHYPVRPSRLAEVQARLADRLAHLPGPAVLIALAETATGLGQGIFEAWLARTGRSDILFQHSTRYRLERPLALHFQEGHSHATTHLVHEPVAPHLTALFRRAATLVLVDDEISTGRTLTHLAAAYRDINPGLSAVHFVCLTDWLDPVRRAEIAEQVGRPVQFHSLLQGKFALEENPTFDPEPIPNVVGNGERKDAFLPRNFGRVGLGEILRLDLDGTIRPAGIQTGERLLILGTGEFIYPPFLLARRLEELGWDVHFQSTTRSPLHVDGDITSVLEFVDNYYDDMANYLYNVVDRHYDRVLVGYETWPLPSTHVLPKILDAVPVCFG